LKLKKLFKKAENFLDSDERSRKEKKKCIKHVLKKLRKYENEINEQIKNESSKETIKHLKKRIALTHAQRKKGMILLKSLKKSSDSASEPEPKA
jgi:predicted RecB family nuclease